MAIAYVSGSSAADNSTAVVVTAPPAIAAGNALIAFLAHHAGTNVTVTPPAGWTLIRRTDFTTFISGHSFYKVATVSEPASYTFTISATNRVACAIAQYSGTHPVTPIDASAGQPNQSDIYITAPSVTPTISNSVLIGLFAPAAATVITPPATMVERLLKDSAGGGNGVTVEVADEVYGLKVPTGTRVATAKVTARNVGQLLAVRRSPQTYQAAAQIVGTATATSSFASVNNVARSQVEGSVQASANALVDNAAEASVAGFAAVTESVASVDNRASAEVLSSAEVSSDAGTIYGGQAIISGSADINIDGNVIYSGAGAEESFSTTDADAQVDNAATATVESSAILFANTIINDEALGTLFGTAEIEPPLAQVENSDSGILTGTADLHGAALVINSSSIQLEGSAEISSESSVENIASADLSSTASEQAAANVTYVASAQVSVTASLSIDAAVTYFANSSIASSASLSMFSVVLNRANSYQECSASILARGKLITRTNSIPSAVVERRHDQSISADVVLDKRTPRPSGVVVASKSDPVNNIPSGKSVK